MSKIVFQDIFISAGHIETDDHREPERGVESNKNSIEFLNINVDEEKDDGGAFNHMQNKILMPTPQSGKSGL